jgi:hypothetical protein
MTRSCDLRPVALSLVSRSRRLQMCDPEQTSIAVFAMMTALSNR